MAPASPAPIDRTRPDDVLQLAVDRGRVPMAICALLVLDPANRPGPEAVRAALLDRARAVPRLRRRLVRTPPGAGRPVWLEAGSAALDGLLSELVVADDRAGGGDVPRGLLDATSALVVERMARDRPLWRARLLLDAGGRVAGVAVAAHHVLADGMGGLAVLAALADRPPGARAAHVVGPEPVVLAEPRPPWPVLARETWSERRRALRGARGSVRRLGAGLEELGLGRPQLAQTCSLLGRTGHRRRLELCTVELGPVHAAARARGATVNDVAVTAVTGGLVALLERRGEVVDELVVSVPVSRRRQGGAVALGNATGAVPVRVPAVPDAETRLAALVDQAGRVRSSARGGSAAVLTPLFRGLAAVGAFQRFVDHQRLVHTFVTNVRGPAERLRLAGAEVTAVVPVAVNPGNVAVSFDVLSYAGTLGVTLVCDPRLVPESRWLAERVAAELTQMTAGPALP